MIHRATTKQRAVRALLAAAVLAFCFVLRPPIDLEAPGRTSTIVMSVVVLILVSLPLVYLLRRFSSRKHQVYWGSFAAAALLGLIGTVRAYQELRSAYSVEVEGIRVVVGDDTELTPDGRDHREVDKTATRATLVRRVAGKPRTIWDETALGRHADRFERYYLASVALAALSALAIAGAWRPVSTTDGDGRAAPTTGPPQPTTSRRRFRVAFSFPGEVRDRANAIAEGIETALGRERVFYDRWYAAELARPNMDLYLQKIYKSESDLLVVMLCADYQRKEWCGLEWRVVRDLIKGKESDRIMFLRLDQAPVEGLLSIDGYLDIAEVDDEAVAAAILSRVGHEAERTRNSEHFS